MTRTIERRAVEAQIEIRRADDGAVSLRGYAAMFDAPAHGEVVRSSAFTRTLSQRDNVRLLVNHDGVPLASTRAGTMTLGVDERGLWVDAPSLDLANPTVQELVSAMDRGDIDQMSFAFESIKEGRADDGTRELREVRLYDVSVVTFPWYETTTASIDRDLDRALVSLRSRSPLSSEERDLIVVALDSACVTVLGNEIEDNEGVDPDAAAEGTGADPATNDPGEMPVTGPYTPPTLGAYSADQRLEIARLLVA